jgi:CheY-like chemotaxis protein
LNDKQTVLVVEDDEDLRDALRLALEHAGFASSGASNGLEALELLQADAEQPDLILLDLWMPVMDGYEFRARQRSNPSLASIPTVVMSGERSPDIDVRPVLLKPIDFSELIGVTTSLLT